MEPWELDFGVKKEWDDEVIGKKLTNKRNAKIVVPVNFSSLDYRLLKVWWNGDSRRGIRGDRLFLFLTVSRVKD